MARVTQENFKGVVVEWRDAAKNGTEVLLDTGEWVPVNRRTASLIWMARMPCTVLATRLSRIDPVTQERIEALQILHVYPPPPPVQMTHPRFRLRRKYIDEDDIFGVRHEYVPD